MQLTKGTAEKRLADLGMDDMPVIEVRPTPHMVPADWYQRRHELIKQFTTSLMDATQELAFMGLSQDEFMNLLMGQAVPENLSIRFRVPLIWGGKMEIENMFMCRTFPHAQNLDRFIMEQAGADTIWMPNPARKIYLPANSGTGGDGGNATEDRLSQIAAAISANTME